MTTSTPTWLSKCSCWNRSRAQTLTDLSGWSPGAAVRPERNIGTESGAKEWPQTHLAEHSEAQIAPRDATPRLEVRTDWSQCIASRGAFSQPECPVRCVWGPELGALTALPRPPAGTPALGRLTGTSG